MRAAGTSPVAVGIARPAEYAAIGALLAAVYVDGGFSTSERRPFYERVAERARASEILVARDAAGATLGTVGIAFPPSPEAEFAAPGDAELRLLAVAVAARGSGAGRALLREAVAIAVSGGATRVVLRTRVAMVAARALYESSGFHRIPMRDAEVRGRPMLAYELRVRPRG